MQVQLINHACVVLKSGPVKLLCDPWLSGSCFNDGWDLIVDNEFKMGDLDFTHIWLSHEHPDHFSPKDLQSLDPLRRVKTTIYYQETEDKKVKKFCQDLGYKCEELRDFERTEIVAGVFITCAKSRGSDSWLLFEDTEHKLLNLNDCFVNKTAELEKVKSVVGRLDVLMSQYSFANWVGNEEDVHSQSSIAKMYLEIFAKQVKHFDPVIVIPFANFTWYSNEENFYLNRYSSKISDAVDALGDFDCTVVALAPFDTYTIGHVHDNEKALEFWEKAYAGLSNKVRRKSRPVDMNTLNTLFYEYQKRLKEKNDWSAILAAKEAGNLPCSYVYLTDHNCALKFDITDELKVVNQSKEECSITMGSDSLFFLLKHEWGRGSLQINGRFQANYKRLIDFIRQTQIAFANNIGLSYPTSIAPASVFNPNTFILRVAEGNAEDHL